MNKRTKGRKLNRKRDQRQALMRHLAEALVKYERIETTEAKAKELRPYVEKFVTRAKNNNLAATRLLRQNFNEDISKKLVTELGPRFKERKGGYTRIIKRVPRGKDNASRAIIEFVE
jgi:large subunit ribosomal protein L17